MLSPPKSLDQIQPNLVCENFTHMHGACNGKKMFGPAPWGPGKGSKGQIQYYKITISKAISKVFLYQTLCVFSQMIDTKHIRQDFHSVSWVMP